MEYKSASELNDRSYKPSGMKRIAKYVAIGFIGYYFLKGCIGCTDIKAMEPKYETLDSVVEVKWQR